jgi:NAD/NADP transhydrogenase beta subunit
MNRSLTNVLFGGIAGPVSADAHKIEGTITKTTVDDTVDALTNADSVILVKRKGFCVFAQNQFIFSLRSLDMVWPSPRLSMPFQKSQQYYDPKASMSEYV